MLTRSLLSLFPLALSLACGSGGSPDGSGGSGSQLPHGGDPELTPPDRLDLLLMVDNSWAMDGKQALLADGVTRLLERLREPLCVGPGGTPPSAAGPTGGCPAGQSREFQPIRDIQVGVISSSLGDGGDNQICSAPESRDMAHLIGSLERGAGAPADEHGILRWRAGEPFEPFGSALGTMVLAAGQRGCGYEQSLEAWYRFLVDPAPYAALERVRCRPEASSNDCIGPALDAGGNVRVDEQLLQQRAAFLRPDSLLVIVSLSDENDCSLRVGGQSWRVASSADRMPRAASVCSQDPNAACCYSCGGALPAGCSADPICSPSLQLTREEDAVSLRCFDQKRRFGTDFLYPTERYVNALRSSELCLKAPSLASAGCAEPTVPNPLFAGGRPLAHVLLASIVGVPWESIRSPSEQGSGFRLATSEELAAGGWDEILGEPGQSPPVPPADAFLIESAVPRGDIPTGNPINGREYDTAYGGSLRRDLQHACLFRLPQPIDCSSADPSGLPCACEASTQSSPVCEEQPGVSPPGPLQYWGRAYPGPRHLEVLRGHAAAGGEIVLGSICSSSLADASRSDYGYRAVSDALVARIAPRLRAR